MRTVVCGALASGGRRLQCLVFLVPLLADQTANPPLFPSTTHALFTIPHILDLLCKAYTLCSGSIPQHTVLLYLYYRCIIYQQVC